LVILTMRYLLFSGAKETPVGYIASYIDNVTNVINNILGYKQKDTAYSWTYYIFNYLNK
jgi:hypothetical protein